MINWDDISTVDGEDNRLKRQIRGSIAICQHGEVVINQDEGSYDLPHLAKTGRIPLKTQLSG